MAATDDAERPDAAEALDRFWDGLLRAPAVHPGGPPPLADGLDPTLAEAVRRLHADDDAPAPDAGFAVRLWQELVAATPVAPEPTPGPPRRDRSALGFVASPGGRGRLLVELAVAAALVVAIFGGGLGQSDFVPGLGQGSPTASAHTGQAPDAGGDVRVAACGAAATRAPGGGRAVEPSPTPLGASFPATSTATADLCKGTGP